MRFLDGVVYEKCSHFAHQEDIIEAKDVEPSNRRIIGIGNSATGRKFVLSTNHNDIISHRHHFCEVKGPSTHLLKSTRNLVGQSRKFGLVDARAY